MIRILWLIANRMFCLSRREFSREFDPGTGRSQLVRIEQRIYAPNAFIVSCFVLFAVVYYGVLSLPLTFVLSGRWTLAHWPALIVLALNSTYRFILKFHERLATKLDWDQPVGRESPSTRATAVAIGFAAGFSSGSLADWLVAGGQFTDLGLGMALLVGIAEAVMNGQKIGGGAMYDEIGSPVIEEYRKVVSKDKI